MGRPALLSRRFLTLARHSRTLSQASCASVHEADSSRVGLDVGVVGLGAVGTIFFTQLCSTLQHTSSDQPPLLRSIDAFVKPHHLEKLKQQKRIALCEPQKEQSPFATVVLEEKDDVLVSPTSSIRIQTLDCGLHEHRPLDVVLVALKAFDSADAIQKLQADRSSWLKNDAVFVLVQNGMGELPSSDLKKTNELTSYQYVNGVTYIGGRMVSMGNVIVSGLATEPTCLAPVASTSSDELSQAQLKKLRVLIEALNQSGLKSQLVSQSAMKTMLWRKLLVNVAINPIASVLGASNGSVGACEWSKRSVKAVIHEAVAIAEKEHVDLQSTEEELIEYVLRVAVNTRMNVCSTLADLRKGNRTEIDALTGQVIELGKKHSVPTPINALLYDLVKALEEQQLRIF